MKRRTILLATAGTLVLSVVASLAAISSAAAGTAGATAAAFPTPKVPNAAAIKRQYGGESITFIGDSVGGSHNRDLALAKQFTKDTGIKVKVVPHPAASDASYSQLARVFSSKSSSFDVAMIDVVWPGAFAPYLVDLKPKLGTAAKQHAQGIIQNNTIDGKLVAMPWFGDFGILYYRTDLLRKYGYTAPPKTWNQLFAMANKIQTGEQAANDKFYGFVFQGNSYEGLTCDALEWYESAGAGGFIDDGKVTINNPKGAAILNLFARLGAGFDIVSGGELARVIAAGGDPRKTLFSGVGKSEAELRFALEKDIGCINLESEAELTKVDALARALRDAGGGDPPGSPPPYRRPPPAPRAASLR